MITEIDLFRTFLEMLGARQRDIRLTVLVPEEPGQLARLTQAIAGQHPGNSLVMCKIDGVGLEQVRAQVEPLVEQLVDIREVSLQRAVSQ